MFFNCKHPVQYLVVEKDATETKIDYDYTQICYHLACLKCREKVSIKYAKINGGVEGFLGRLRVKATPEA